MAGIRFDSRAIQIIAESKIQAAMDNGEFENLPGLGKPFEFDEREYNPHWWIKRKLEREQLTVTPLFAEQCNRPFQG